ncbi:hypothetical protein CLD22_30705, partial [Rubrivivax gelatinosus]|nr:hypothetical protein [Rubrivivax gelatinosus]
GREEEEKRSELADRKPESPHDRTSCAAVAALPVLILVMPQSSARSGLLRLLGTSRVVGRCVGVM